MSSNLRQLPLNGPAQVAGFSFQLPERALTTMAARTDRSHSELVRSRIRLSQLVTRLQNNALGRNGVNMTQQQIDSAKFLIGKAMANLPETKELTGPGGGAIQSKHEVIWTAVDAT